MTVIPYAQAKLSTKYGKFDIYVFRESESPLIEHVVLVKGDLKNVDAPLVRIHSECKTGDVFGSLRCDCGPQLHFAFKKIREEKCGMIIYLDQEGRGIGLGNKIRAYALQDQGYDTIEANNRLGFDADLREFNFAAEILKYFGVDRIRLMTNNPRKVRELETKGIKVVERVPCFVRPNRFNISYIKTKVRKMGHKIDLKFLEDLYLQTDVKREH